MIEENGIICIDIECAPFYDGRASKTKDVLKVVGVRYKNGQKLMLHHPAQQLQIQNILSSHKYIVGHNLKDRKYIGMDMGYDVAVMKRSGYRFLTHNNEHHVFIDTQEITEKRARSMLYQRFTMKQMGLDFLTKYFNLVDEKTMKGEFDYKKMRGNLTPKDLLELKDYLFRDLDATWALFEYYYNLFSGIKDKLRPEHKHNFNWLRGAAGSTGYRWYCNIMNLPELYDFSRKGDFSGAWMWVHELIDYFKNVYVYDFASLYPNMRASLNLDSRCPIDYVDKEKMIDTRNGRPLWHSGGVFKSVEEDAEHGIVGYYHSDELNPFAVAVLEAFHSRRADKVKFKETGDMTWYYSQLGKKILMNASYGAGGSPAFVSMYDAITAEDTTRAGQTLIRHAKETLEMRGFIVAYLHTDSLYIELGDKDPQELKDVIAQINKEQKASLPFDEGTHDFTFEKRIEKMWLHKKDDGTHAKQRNFIVYEDKDGELKADFTGGKLADFNVSKVAKKVWDKVISQDLICGKENIYYSIDMLLQHCKAMIKEEPELCILRKKSKEASHYKAKTSQPAKITAMYGAGEHSLVPNKYLGVGDSAGKHFLCTMSELKEAFGDAWLDAIDYSKYITELKVFVLPENRKLIKKI